jgi:AraC-like DNA-binding protein
MHQALAGQFGEEVVHVTLCDLHAYLFDTWLSTAIEVQKCEVKQYLYGPNSCRSRARLDSPSAWDESIPDSAMPFERLLFEIDLGVILNVLIAEEKDRLAACIGTAGLSSCCTVIAAMNTVKVRNGDLQVTLGNLSGPLKVSAQYLGRMFQQHTGTAFRSYLRYVRMFRAAKLLTSGIPLKQVAKRLSYTDLDNFRRDFQKAIGISPTRYRQQKTSHMQQLKPNPALAVVG